MSRHSASDQRSACPSTSRPRSGLARRGHEARKAPEHLRRLQ
jgi:hypothetical protein